MIEIFGVLVEPDVEATREVYATFEPYRCTCSMCRNFLAAWHRVLPPSVVRVLGQLGIEPTKPHHITHFARNSPGSHLYEVEWAFLGGVPPALSQPAPMVKGRERNEYVGAGGIPCSQFDRSGRRCSISVNFDDVPWLIDEPEPD
ncbi:MAG: hypothetical protein ACKVU4_14605 [Phycisphaerales bacterium]